MREPGYYWVRRRNYERLGTFVAEWSIGGVWFFAGQLYDYTDSEIEVVGERLMPPEPPKG